MMVPVTETPYLRVVRGEPTAEELAALVAVLAARSAAAPAPTRRPRSAWADPGRRLGLTHRAGPGAWRRSTLPA
jgi:Acyl-CoA carboxylase epsilon subunit